MHQSTLVTDAAVYSWCIQLTETRIAVGKHAFKYCARGNETKTVKLQTKQLYAYRPRVTLERYFTL